MLTTKEWKTAKQPKDKTVLKYGEYFRKALEESLDSSERGTAKEISVEVGYKNQSMVTNIVAGKRIPDFKKAVMIAHILGSDFIDFLILGRRLIDPRRGLVAVENRQREPWEGGLRESFQKLRCVYRSENTHIKYLVEKILNLACEIESLSESSEQLKKRIG